MATYTDKMLAEGTYTLTTNTSQTLYTVSTTWACIYSFRVQIFETVNSSFNNSKYPAITINFGSLPLLVSALGPSTSTGTSSSQYIPKANTAIADTTSLQTYMDLMASYDYGIGSSMRPHNSGVLSNGKTITFVTSGGTAPSGGNFSATIYFNISGIEIS